METNPVGLRNRRRRAERTENPNQYSPNQWRIVEQALILQTSTKTAVGIVEAWRLPTISDEMKSVEEGRVVMEDAQEEGGIDSEMDVAMHQAVEKEVHIRTQKCKREDVVDDDIDARDPPRARSVTYIKDEKNEANKLRERNLRRRTLQVLDNAFAATAPNISSLRPSHSVNQLNSNAGSSASLGPVDNAKRLKAAREKEMVEAVRRQNTNMLRLQLDSQSARYVQEVVRQTRAVPVQVDRQSQVFSRMHTRTGVAQRLVLTIET
ncbi:hypothetical protein IFR05_010760 [Cadophora sp. M221]|nr:hypothetical protein IFR05_010760 [Cadophora sp. M221]